jgi:hypothetical protein
VQTACDNVLQGDRLCTNADDGIGTGLMSRQLDRLHVLEHAAIELDVIAMAKIGDNVLAEAWSENESVVAVAAYQDVITQPNLQDVF